MPVCGHDGYQSVFYHTKCEVLDIGKKQWKSIEAYPYDQGLI